MVEEWCWVLLDGSGGVVTERDEQTRRCRLCLSTYQILHAVERLLSHAVERLLSHAVEFKLDLIIANKVK